MRLLRALAVVLTATTAVSSADAATLDQMAGQMVVVGFQGAAIGDKPIAGLIEEIKSGDIGGVMYLKTNVKSLAAVKALNAAFKAANPGLQPFITLDQEGGKVERLTGDVGFPEMPSAQDVARQGTPGAAEAVYAKTAGALAGLGFNVNSGPVVDLNVNPSNPIIGKYGRSFGTDPAQVAAYAGVFIDAHPRRGC